MSLVEDRKVNTIEISSFKVENFKSVRDSGSLDIDDLSILIGKNDAGKSSLLEALRCFLEPPNKANGKPDDEHFHKDCEEDIVLEATLAPVPDEVRKRVDDQYSPDASKWNLSQVCERKDGGGKARWTIYLNGEKLSGGAITTNDGTLTRKPEVRDFIWENFLPDPIWIPAERDISEDTKLKGGTVLTRLLEPILTKEGFDNGTLQTQIKDLEESLEDTVGTVGSRLTDRMQSHLSDLERVEIDPGSVDVVKSIKPEVNVKDEYLEDSVHISERGSGVGSLLYLSLMQTYVDMQVGEGYFLLFEEPGNFLHPAAERKMLGALRSIADEGQVAISTHSQTMIDQDDEANMHVVRRLSGETRFEHVGDDAFTAIDEIGARNSDLLQSDFVIYVEGPTDIKVLEEIAQCAIDEWTEYNITIQHLGGTGNLHHCEPDRLEKINRNFAVLLDSDRDSMDEPPKKEVRKIAERFRDHNRRCKILKRKEIENYYSRESINEICYINADEGFVGKCDDMAEKIAERVDDGYTFNKVEDGKDIVRHMYKNGDKIEEVEEFLRECLREVREK